MEKIPVYFVPGLACSPMIFEYIKLPEDRFEAHFIEWKIPYDNESMEGYCLRLIEEIKHTNPVLVGVSMGGIIVQEVSRLIPVRKVVIISSVKSSREFPRRMLFARMTRLYAIFPTRMIQNLDRLKVVFPAGNPIGRRLRLYEKFMSVRDKKYLDWSFKNIIEWRRSEPDPAVVHIHGTADKVFPARYIEGYIPVKGGTHIMIINRFSWINEHLPGIMDNKDYKLLPGS